MSSLLTSPTQPNPNIGCLGGLQKQGVVDIDANNAGNPLACADYARDIFDHLHEVEVRAGLWHDELMMKGQ